MDNTKQKTAEDVLKEHLIKYFRNSFPDTISDEEVYKKVRVFHEEEKSIIAAMEEYASQYQHPVPDASQPTNWEKDNEAWCVWKDDQKINPTPVNPHAFVYGYNIAMKKYKK